MTGSTYELKYNGQFDLWQRMLKIAEKDLIRRYSIVNIVKKVAQHTGYAIKKQFGVKEMYMSLE